MIRVEHGSVVANVHHFQTMYRIVEKNCVARVPLLIQELAVHVCDKLVFGDHLEDGLLI